MRREAGIREVKAKLSALVGRVRRGEVITITDRGRPVARIVPIGSGELSLDERMAELQARGWILPRQAPAGILPPAARLTTKGLAQRYLREDRDGR